MNDLPDHNLERIEFRIKTLEVQVSSLCSTLLPDMKEDCRRAAEQGALRSVLEELAEREGVSKEEFRQRYDNVFGWFYGQILQIIEGSQPSLAARLDSRAIVEASTLESCPSIFVPLPPD